MSLEVVLQAAMAISYRLMKKEEADLVSFASNDRAGEFSDILSILTGCVLIHERKTSWTSARFADVFSEPGKACDLDTLCPIWSNADL